MSIEDILKMPDGKEKAKKLAVSGLLVQAGEVWHKQWYFERILEALGYDLIEIRQSLRIQGYDWDDGIAP